MGIKQARRIGSQQEINTILTTNGDFSNCTFFCEVNFDNITLNKTVSFNEATFRAKTSFINTVFDCEASFDDATFLENVRFWSAKFKKKVTFANTKFNKLADFY